MAHNVTSPSRNRSHIDSSSRDVLQPSAAVSPREEWEDWMKWDDPLNTIEATASKDPNATKKRKSLSDEGQDFQESVQKQRPPPATRSHNAVERRYRTNINQKITALRDSIPSLRAAVEPGSQTSGLEDVPVQKLNKATVLSTAVGYIHDLENEISQLKARLEEAHKPRNDEQYIDEGKKTEAESLRLDVCNKDTVSSTGSSTSSNPVRGMIDVPEDMRRLRSAALQSQSAQETYIRDETPSGGPDSIGLGVNGAKKGRLIGKLMVGSFAGLMVMHGLDKGVEDENHVRKRSLMALPTRISWRMTFDSSLNGGIPITSTHSHLLFVLLEMFIILAVAGFGVFLYAFRFRPKPSKQPRKLDSVPSLASPLEVRRNAWLTAIQTVRVPRHKMFPEWAAVNLEALQYVLRHLVGWSGYSWLAGKSEEDEMARIRAWDIAIDAQLMGGDAEISGSRLVLTILASGTLPRTPARLILKAIHLRILLWKTLQPSENTIWSIVHRIAAALADYQWRLAQDMQKTVVSHGQSPNEAEDLPEHLAAVLKLTCKEALTGPIIHRAQNLAWSRPTCDDASHYDEMDFVVEDCTIRAPNDALCAWVSSSTLQRCLLTTLSTKEVTSEIIEWDFGMALHCAPPASIAQARSLAGNAVFVTANRRNALAMLLQDFPSRDEPVGAHVAPGSTENSTFVDSSLPKAVCHDVGLAIRCAIALVALQDRHEEPQELERALQTVTLSYVNTKELTWLSFASANHLVCILNSIVGALGTHQQQMHEISSRLLSWLEESNSAPNAISQHMKQRLQSALSQYQPSERGLKQTARGSKKESEDSAVLDDPTAPETIQRPFAADSAETNSLLQGVIAEKDHRTVKDRRPSHCSDDSGYMSTER